MHAPQQGMRTNILGRRLSKHRDYGIYRVDIRSCRHHRSKRKQCWAQRWMSGGGSKAQRTSKDRWAVRLLEGTERD